MNRDVAGLRRVGDAEVGENGGSVHEDPFYFRCETRVSSETIHAGFSGGKGICPVTAGKRLLKAY
jgi:hypothetical protein